MTCVGWSCGALLAIAPLLADPYPRRADLDITGYRYAIALSDSSDEIRMDATVAFRFVSGGRDDLTLDLVGRNGAGRGMVVDAVTDSVGPLPFSHRNDRLAITLRRPGITGGAGRVMVRYHGVPAAALRIGPNKFGDRTFGSDNWPDLARHWLVGIDHPYDKATSEFIVTAPSHYQVVSNGLLVEETDLGQGLRRTYWRQSVPIATWLQTLGVARYAVGPPAPSPAFRSRRGSTPRIGRQVSPTSAARPARRCASSPTGWARMRTRSWPTSNRRRSAAGWRPRRRSATRRG